MKPNQTKPIRTLVFGVRGRIFTFAILGTAANALPSAHYVDLNSTNATPPYTSWATAATNIQDAVDAAVAGDEVVVTNGLYAGGGRSFDALTTNRVDIDKPLKVRSVNGPRVTTVFAGSVGRFSIRCAHLTRGASICGFTMTSDLFSSVQGGGGGVLCDDRTAVVSNCVISGNAVLEFAPGYGWLSYGGGACGGTLNNCTLIGNTAGGNEYVGFGGEGYGGGAYGCTLNNCNVIGNSATGATLSRGGGAYNCILNNCALTGNSVGLYPSSEAYGGGADLSTLNNCVLSSNYWPEAVSFCTLNNCTLTANGSAAYKSSLYNCIVYSNYIKNYDYNCTLNYCCTTPPPTNGVSNITNAPLFIDEANGDLRLQSNSPCINAGNNASAPAGPDLDGNPRIAGGTVDIGAYEFQSPVSKISYAWLQQFGLPINDCTDTADPDGDGMNNWQEWVCGTNPTNALSVLRMLPPSTAASGFNVSWQSVTTRNYVLERSTNLVAQPAFLPLATNIPGQIGTTTFTDANAIGAGPWFYRVGVRN